MTHLDSREQQLEAAWLERVLKEAEKQRDDNRSQQERFNQDYKDTQREMWEDVGSISIANGLDQIVDFMQYINTMKTQQRSQDMAQKLEAKYERMLASPYFGRMDFEERGTSSAEACYIGVSNLVDDEYDFLVYDWRAPISSMFYEHEIGEASYECPEGSIDGRLTLKRQYKIEDGRLRYMFDSSLKIDDEVLQDMLSKSSDNQMKAIVTTIQRDQNKIIRNEAFKNLIVQGPAGSGKTSVALHRIAYLLYKHREKIKPQNIIIFSPNDIFNDYIASVLPQLGEDNMYQTTFKTYMHQALGGNYAKEDYYQMIEYTLAAPKDERYRRRIDSIRFKASPVMVDLLKGYVKYLENEPRGFKDLSANGKIIASGSEISGLFYQDYAQMPLKRRLQKLKNRLLFLLEPYEKQRIDEVASELENTEQYLSRSELMALSTAQVRAELKSTYDQIYQMTAFDLMALYRKMYEKLESFAIGLALQEFSEKLGEIRTHTLKNLNSGQLHYEDQPPLLYLKGALGDQPDTSEIRYVIIDEAQDYAPLQYEIFSQLFKNASMTILGDLHQSINPHMNVGHYEHIHRIFDQQVTGQINLTKSYRSTMEITQFARKLLGRETTDEWVERSGEKPMVLSQPDEKAIQEALILAIHRYRERGHQSIGIITRTAREAKAAYRALKEKIEVKAILKDDDRFEPGTLIIPSYLAKGLEFDVVLIYNAGGENYAREEERLLLYTACTRALHVLNVFYAGERSPLLAGTIS